MGDTDTHQLREMASQLGAMLNVEGKKERAAWLKLRGKLAEFATLLSVADPETTRDLVTNAKQAIGSLNLGHREAQALLVEMMGTFGRIGAEHTGGSKAIPIKDLIVLVAQELSMIPLVDSTHVPMIDGIEFNEDNVDAMISDWVSPSMPYGVVSIVGPQSSGKSYLLNQIFGADFPVMNKLLGWAQTTKGIWMSRSIGPSLLILDVEGFDGKERGEDKRFENQAALFALTVSDLMMVNIAEADINRDTGGGKPLFETIFQERTKLPAGITKILVVLRRCDEETGPSVLNSVIENMKEIWKSVYKNEKELALKFEEYIEVEVIALPEKAMPDFQAKVTELRKRISESTLDPNKGGKVPASSFTYHSKDLWDKIKQNKRLDLPSMKVAFTRMYCREIVKDALVSSVTHKELLEGEKSPRDFKILSDTLLDSTITKYDKETSMYDEELRKEERVDLIDKIKMIHVECSQKLMQVVRINTFEQFKSEVATRLKQIEETGDVEIVDEWKKKFTTSCEDLKDFGEGYFHNICAEVHKELHSYTSKKMLELKVQRATNDLASAANDKDRMEFTKILENMKEERNLMAEEIKLLREMQELEHERANEAVQRRHEEMMQMQIERNERLEQKVLKLKEKNKKVLVGRKSGWCSIM